ncbi:MAG: DUF402 domain-containing protein [Acidimicrobiales bacterium]|nr:DUF402 domain-containing protein [Acidimicrobiales bacterium]
MAWSRGDVIMWTYRRGVIPMRVVEDSERALVVWQAPQTVYLQATPRDGTPLRERPVAERFTIERDFAVVPWLGDGTLRIAQPGAAHSSWLFRSPDLSGAFLGWYGNLEAPLRRSDIGVHTVDHLLDVFVDATGAVHWKDEDEFAFAIERGDISAEQAAAIRDEGQRVFDAMCSRAWPYDGSWIDWRPDPEWSVPPLPDEFAAMAGMASYDVFPAKEKG